MDERKNKMTDERYREILPVAYMTAAIVKGRQPRFRFTAIQKTARPILRITRLPIRGAAFPCQGKVHPSIRERLKIHDCQVRKTKSCVCVSQI